LDNGRVAEFAPPGELLKKENGLFRGLVEAARIDG
jgi:ABC-type multidrug transport system fused ATPase/permease subunit